MLDKSFELEQGSFLYSSGGGVFVLLGLDYLYTGVKDIKELFAKHTEYANLHNFPKNDKKHGILIPCFLKINVFQDILCPR